MKLIIRCDDVSYFTQPKELEMWFKDIWDNVPIHLAVIPCVYDGQEETPIKTKDWDNYYIGHNKTLCRFLKKKIKEKKVVIWQHGITHKNYGKHFECETLYNHIPYGRQMLEIALGQKIKVFVAPHDRFSKKFIKHVEENNMDICRGFSPLPREFMWRSEYFWNFFNIFLFWLLDGTKHRFDEWFDYGKHKELYSYRINQITPKNIDDIIKRHKDGILCITVHHRSMDIISLEKLKYIMERIK